MTKATSFIPRSFSHSNVSCQKLSTLTIADAYAEDLPVSFSVDGQNHQGNLGNNAIVLGARLAVYRIDDEERKRPKRSFIESTNPGVQPYAKLAHR